MADITKTQPMDLSRNPVDKFNGIDGLSGVEPEDIQLPSLYVVQANAKAGSTNLIGGGVAKPGKLYASDEMREYDSLDVVIVSAVKGKKIDSKTGEPYSLWRVILFPFADPMNPKVIYCKRTADWAGWRPFFNNLPSLGVKGLYEKIVRITPRQDSNKGGKQYYVPEFIIVGDTPEELANYAKVAGKKLSTLRDSEIDEDENDDLTGVLKKDKNFEEQNTDEFISTDTPF